MFVDEIKIMGLKKNGVIARVKLKLAATFKMVDMRPIRFYLGLEIERIRQKRIIKLFQPIYIQKILRKYHFKKANPTNIPIKEAALGPNFTKATKLKKKDTKK